MNKHAFMRLINAERLLDMTTTEALDYIESGESDFDIEAFKDELLELKYNSDHPMYIKAIDDIIWLLEDMLDAAQI